MMTNHLSLVSLFLSLGPVAVSLDPLYLILDSLLFALLNPQLRWRSTGVLLDSEN